MELNTIYNDDCRLHVDEISNMNVCIVTDPPYNVGYHYEGYEDNLDEYDYLSILRYVIGKNPAVVIHYGESLHKLSMTLNRAPDRCVAWVYNSNTPRQHSDIAFYGIKPDFSKVSQPYKNPNDKRIKERMEAGLTCKMYDWFEQDQIKNVEKKRMSIDHPCVIPLEVMDKIVKLIPEEYVIIDPFCGTGTTLIAAKKNGRHYIGFEKQKKYFELATRRMSEETAQTSLFYGEHKMTESRERFIEARQELYRHVQPKPEFVHCCKCGRADKRANMGVVGYNVYKCWECLAGIKEEA